MFNHGPTTRNADKRGPPLTVATEYFDQLIPPSGAAAAGGGEGRLGLPRDGEQQQEKQRQPQGGEGEIGEEYIPDTVARGFSSNLHQLLESKGGKRDNANFQSSSSGGGMYRSGSGVLSPRTSDTHTIAYQNSNIAAPITPASAPGTTTPGGSDQYLPGLDFNINPSAAQSPTLGLSEAEWKAIPFSTRRKLRAAIQQDNNIDPASPVSAGGSLSRSSTMHGACGASAGATTAGSAIPFSRRHRERAASGSLTRSMSAASTDSSASNSPAFQFLSRLGNPASEGVGGGQQGSDPELGEQVGEYIIGKLIGYGGFSQVKEAHTIDNSTGEKVVRAVKVVQKQNAGASQELMERIQSEFDHEVSIWKMLSHEHILPLLLVDDTDRATYCFTHRITGGTLFDLVKNTRGNVDQPTVLRYVRELSSALLYLHETMRIVHRDIKLENCLLECVGKGEHKLILCDFGMSDYYVREDEHKPPPQGSYANHVIGPADTSSLFNQYHNIPQYPLVGNSRPNTAPTNNNSRSAGGNSLPSSQNFGSLPYASPQLLTSNVPLVEPEVDIWALGVVVFALYMGNLPWNHAFLPKLRMMILQGAWDKEGLTKKAGSAASNLVDGCLEMNPQSRLKIREIIDHEHLQD
ncbi:hypothetical protein TRICI_002074 [Trichomonascus ciferrii]|uniref:Protein kinase domain-containing protein n=1 Tax=Trichomonascus ciferrii TaxID=44093 RepID=A0A642VC86_9ASCO|nr:hypothetical protein TRICI_002074 [Trichomonascus ciferrii]